MGKMPRGLVPSFLIMKGLVFVARGDARHYVRREVGRCGSLVLIDADF